MLLSSGCSFTAGQYAEEHCFPTPYPVLASNRLKLKHGNLAEPGADNNYIINRAIKYLLTYDQFNLLSPKFVTVQTSDHFRKLIFKRTHSGVIKPNRRPTFKDRRCYTKINHWKYEKYTKKPSSVITVRKMPFADGQIRGSDIVAYGDDTLNAQRQETLLLLNHLNTVCEERNIPLCIINYYGLGDWIEDPLFRSLKSKYLIANPYYGLYNELCWLGFNRPDGYHFDMEAHQWQAEAIVRFFKNEEQISVSDTDHPNLEPIHQIHQDYTDEL